MVCVLAFFVVSCCVVLSAVYVATWIAKAKYVSWFLLSLLSLFFLLQTSDYMDKQERQEENPGIEINYADERSIDDCLSLGALSSVGPANGVPDLVRGKMFC